MKNLNIQANGDALGNLFQVMASLLILDKSLEEWSAVYDDLPSCNTKVQVSNRYCIKTSYDEQSITEPEGTCLCLKKRRASKNRANL